MIAPTPAELLLALEWRTSAHLADVGLFLDVAGPGGRTFAFEEGLRRGLRDVGRSPVAAFGPLDPLDLTDLSSFELDRILDRAEWSALSRVLLNWAQVARREGRPAYATTLESTERGGWRWEDRQAVQDAVDRLAAMLVKPYSEPGPSLVVNPPVAHQTPWRGDWGWRR